MSLLGIGSCVKDEYRQPHTAMCSLPATASKAQFGLWSQWKGLPCQSSNQNEIMQYFSVRHKEKSVWLSVRSALKARGNLKPVTPDVTLNSSSRCPRGGANGERSPKTLQKRVTYWLKTWMLKKQPYPRVFAFHFKLGRAFLVVRWRNGVPP